MWLIISQVIGIINHVIQMGSMTVEIFTVFLNNGPQRLNDKEMHHLYKGPLASLTADNATDDIT